MPIDIQEDRVIVPGPYGDSFRDCPSFPGYRIGLDGTVWSCMIRDGQRGWKQSSRWKQLKTHRNTGNYVAASLSRNKRSIVIPIHRLILEAFVGLKPEGMECRHLDGNRRNNNLDNLRWGTHVENMADMKRHGRLCGARGEACHLSKLKATDIDEIFRLDANLMPYEAIASRFGCSAAAIRLVVCGKSWKHLGHVRDSNITQMRRRIYRGPRGSASKHSKLSESDIPTIRQLSASGLNKCEIARRYKVSRVTIHRILNGRIWTHA